MGNHRVQRGARTSGSDDDAALVAAAQGGDREAFALLITRHHRLLVALCRRALGDPILAEDAVQEATLQALLGLDRLRQPERFGPWLGGIGLNVCYRLLRERSRDVWSWDALCGGRAGPEPADAGADPAELLELAEIRQRVQATVASLPSGQRAAVTLVYLQGLTQGEAAAVLGVEAGAVKARLHKGRAALRQRLSDGQDAVERTLSRRRRDKAAARATEQERDVIDEPGTEQFVEMRVVDVRRGRPQEGHPAHCAVILEETEGDRRLPIWVGEFEGTAIALRLEGVATPRPLTHAFAASLLQAVGGRVHEVQVARLAGEVYYASATVESGTGTTTVDARPSDAIALALLTGAPIRVAAGVLAAAAVPPEVRRVQQENLYAEGTEGTNDIVTKLREAWSSSTAHRSQTEGDER